MKFASVIDDDTVAVVVGYSDTLEDARQLALFYVRKENMPVKIYQFLEEVYD